MQMHVSEGIWARSICIVWGCGRLGCEDVDAQDLANVRRGMRVSIER